MGGALLDVSLLGAEFLLGRDVDPLDADDLEHLGVRASPLPRAPARDPDWEQTDLGFEAA